MENNLIVTEDKSSSVNEILNLDEPEEENLTSEPDVDISQAISKQTAVTSPWSKLVLIALPIGLGFLVFFLMLNGIFNRATSNNNQPAVAEQKNNELDPGLLRAEDKDGDVYAQLALSSQEDELAKLSKTNQKPKNSPTKPKAPVASPVPRISQASSASASRPSTPTASPRAAYVPPPAFSRERSLPRIRTLTPTRTQAADPLSELARLRSIGSFGQIAYAANSDKQPIPAYEDEAILKRKTIPTEKNLPEDLPSTNSEQPTSTGIEKIRPLWQKTKTPTGNKIASVNNETFEARVRYLVTGQLADGVLITPLVKEQSSNIRQGQDNRDGDSRRYVAQLEQDLRDNYGRIAVLKGSLLAIELITVDDSSYAKAQVTSIIRDDAEYPISKGAITVLGAGGTPLIARPFNDKGGEIAQYDLTLGLVSGLSKVGEIINQPDSTEDIRDREYRSTRTSGGNRNLGGAILEGAFGSVGEILSERAKKSTDEIIDRPDVWYVPKNTKVTFIVNRTLELP
ncbi:TrbI/VirB10 family protein [Nostoc sp. MG11]|uniref:TrbI/VirB10 family protein n=1 Tax=Nostoc sp. MG11 TaxID=2721166 RepID=UPI0018688449|nr:TrbI/VirB10 family protein [Nostoc sp. MG11]